MYYWQQDPVFGILCDTVFNDNLVCFTGAGISRGIRRKSDPEKTLPSWHELLHELRQKFPPGRVEDQNDVDALLKVDTAPGDWLIQAASILRLARSNKKEKEEFDKYVRECVEASDSPDHGSSDSHLAIAELEPRGIITFNYDEGHELRWDAEKRDEWDLILPTQEDQMLACIRHGFKRRFLLKAHGSIRGEGPLVLDFESYRDLLVKNPTYRAFVGCVLTQFNLIIVGFGMSDPDFDDFLRMISNEMGGPVRQHVLIIKGDKKPEHIVLQRRYGIHALSIADWSDVPDLLRDAISRPCDRAKQTVSDCVSSDVIKRRLAHQQLSRLSIPGRRIMLSDLRKKLSAAIDESNLHAASEVIYSLGKLGFDEDTKQLLFTLLAPRNHREISAHAALALDYMVRTPADTERLESCLREHLKRPPPKDPDYPDPDNRIPIYLAYLIAKNRRRTAEDDANLRNAPMPFAFTITPKPEAKP